MRGMDSAFWEVKILPGIIIFILLIQIIDAVEQTRKQRAETRWILPPEERPAGRECAKKRLVFPYELSD